MRVGVLAPGRGFRGGLERHAFDLAAGLRERGHEVVLLHGAAGGREGDRFSTAFHDVRPLTDPSCAAGLDVAWIERVRAVEELAPLGQLPAVLATHDHDLSCVRSHRYLPLTHSPCSRPPGLACIAHGCVLVRRRDEERRAPLGLASPYALRKRLHALSARGPLVANSHYVARCLVAAGADAARVTVIYPLPRDSETPASPTPAEGPLLVVAQLVRGKGVDVAIEALAHLPPTTKLEIAGEGPARRELEALARGIAPQRVTFHGYLPPEHIEALYDRARIVLVPSRWPEPFGLVGLEAMRRARPVVGAAHGGVPEWLRDGVTGRLFQPGSARDLARAVESIADPRAMGCEARRDASQRFPFARMLDRVEAICERARSAACA